MKFEIFTLEHSNKIFVYKILGHKTYSHVSADINLVNRKIPYYYNIIGLIYWLTGPSHLVTIY